MLHMYVNPFSQLVKYSTVKMKYSTVKMMHSTVKMVYASLIGDRHLQESIRLSKIYHIFTLTPST